MQVQCVYIERNSMRGPLWGARGVLTIAMCKVRCDPGTGLGRKGCREGACLPAGTRKDGTSWALAPSLHPHLGNPCPTRKGTKEITSAKRACVYARAAVNARAAVLVQC